MKEKTYGKDNESKQGDVEFDKDAFREKCEAVNSMFIEGKAVAEEFPVTDSVEKIAILKEVFCSSARAESGKNKTKTGSNSIEQRIIRAKRRCNLI